ncbi:MULTISPECIES: DUF3311 domain-containing protein [unclassified Streptomyces]|uniref:DUF3311 domain-containing protein n=1 Tax=unclassified Streptomyces TaxID=2593676 RepID=UPI00278BD8D5|nr:MULTISPECIES: DUF3311 domain-containing protein [unclassified Streptomyces]
MSSPPSGPTRRLPRSLWLGLGVPSFALLVVMPLLANTDVYVAGIPLLFLWVFAWFPLTSVCLKLAWRMDRHAYPEDTTSPEEEVSR